HKVKVTIMFRGREMQHPELGMKILDHVAEEVSDVAKVEATPKIDGRNMVMVLAPDRTKKPLPVAKPRVPGEPVLNGDDATDHAEATPVESVQLEAAEPEAAPPADAVAEAVPTEPESSEVRDTASPTV
ncbi:MAG: translation initiation factor, partial [Acidimicrobiia bacterium]|nr:translation initiation factor [Acidimicrobiia bacterium]